MARWLGLCGTQNILTKHELVSNFSEYRLTFQPKIRIIRPDISRNEISMSRSPLELGSTYQKPAVPNPARSAADPERSLRYKRDQ